MSPERSTGRLDGQHDPEEVTAVRCPFCHNADSRVIDSREADEGATTRRRRSCPACGRRFTTVEEAVLAVVKRSGVVEPFNRTKVVAGVRRACQGRPVDEDQFQLLAQQVEDAIRASGAAEVPSHEVGLAILRPLRELDEVAYLRFASVYRSFTSLEDFEKEIGELRERHVVAGTPTLPGMGPPPPRRRGGGRASPAADVPSGT
jgi:transcriptional repressor NrdR